MKGIDRFHRYENEEQADKIIQGNLDCQIPKSDVPETSHGDESPEGIMYTTTFYVGLKLKPGTYTSITISEMQLTPSADGTKSLDISYPVSDFRNIITTNNGYNDETMSVRVIHTRK